MTPVLTTQDGLKYGERNTDQCVQNMFNTRAVPSSKPSHQPLLGNAMCTIPSAPTVAPVHYFDAWLGVASEGQVRRANPKRGLGATSRQPIE